MKFQYATFGSIKISGYEIFTGSLTGSEPEMTIFDRMGDFPSLEKSTKLSVSWYGHQFPVHATIRRKKTA